MSELMVKIEYLGKRACLACAGRIVAGDPCAKLDASLQQLCGEVDEVELDLEQVTFLDSSGIGLLVRSLVRARKDAKTLRITAMSSRVRQTLEMTNVISQFASPAKHSGSLVGLHILFAHPSAEVRTFVAALLKDHGALLETCSSPYDVRLLANRQGIDLIIMAAEFDSSNLPASVTRLLRLQKGIFLGSAEESARCLIEEINSSLAPCRPSGA